MLEELSSWIADRRGQTETGARADYKVVRFKMIG
jgi:hypothetical protein